MICGSGGSKSRLAKAAGAEPAGQRRDEKLHAVVARSTFPSQNVQNTPLSDHFWKLRCRKSARRCGAKHISKSKCTKHTRFGPLLEVQMSKKCTPLSREAHFQVVQNTTCSRHFWRFGCWRSACHCGTKHICKSKCTKHTMFGPLLQVQMSKKCTPLWREAHFEVKMLKTPGVRTTFGGSDVASLRIASLHYITLHFTTLHYTTLHYATTTTTQLHSTTLNYTNYTTVHYTTLHSTTLHYTTLPSSTLHYITLHYTTTTTTQLHSTTLHYTTLHYTTLHYTTLHYTTLPSTTLHYITLHSTTLQLQLRLHNYTPLHSTTLNYTTLHYTTLHCIPLHSTTLHYTALHYTEWHCATDRQVDR